VTRKLVMHMPWTGPENARKCLPCFGLVVYRNTCPFKRRCERPGPGQYGNFFVVTPQLHLMPLRRVFVSQFIFIFALQYLKKLALSMHCVLRPPPSSLTQVPLGGTSPFNAATGGQLPPSRLPQPAFHQKHNQNRQAQGKTFCYS
jgi:hypothetical protein